MPEGKSIYDVAFGAGAETGKYGAELLKTEDVWERMAHRGKVTDWKIEQEVAMADTAMATLGLVSEAYGGYKAKKEFEASLTSTQERAGEAAYTKSETARVLAEKKDKDLDPSKRTKAIEWSALDPSKQAEWTGKFEPEKKKQKWYESLFGKEEEYKFGESGYFTRSSIIASRGLSDATRLEKLMGIGDFTMADEVDLSGGTTTTPGVAATITTPKTKKDDKKKIVDIVPEDFMGVDTDFNIDPSAGVIKKPMEYFN